MKGMKDGPAVMRRFRFVDTAGGSACRSVSNLLKVLIGAPI
ncbi:MAG: hypothetical protein WCG29_06815 [Desulfomonile sp.]